ncbi:hypothetical protein SULI_01460 [Saccharolobus solfataricus]|uniref:Thermopsin n=2 Tax=Saccharolobus solfataricus TaxID=2287 RepID=A0A0E3K6G4_SACSO|nr:hypothetical protein [Saccharolobus solfataricus]AKA72718.1 hypothetical protein SULB_0288 [Saccharolobus solfataricus]AKA75417.1 hypothetical protein SULC_0286 [Saccharolobus solfataricus]AKA78109.1 hypothetical protein SULA_0286 [Saccharolobus solfataricus]AZF67231.1 hypothetical protein SULG_01460 [Saccharolobus solfataricus]AZF69851.1 hypothetical protein SULH_01460 [Saccharolobus solfataricus]
MKRYLILFLVLSSIIFVPTTYSSNQFSFLNIGNTISYNIYETSSRLGTYLTFNISMNLVWNGTAFVINGKSINKVFPAINTNNLTIENISGSYPYPLSVWINTAAAGTPSGFLETGKEFTNYNGIPAVEFLDYNNYTYISLQYMIPLKSYYSININPASNLTYSATTTLTEGDLNFYTGPYNLYNVSFNYVYQNYTVNLFFIVASSSAEINLLNYSNHVAFNITGSKFISLLVPITTFNDLLGVSKFIYNESPYVIVLTSTGNAYYYNTSVPIIGSYIPGTNYYMISIPYSGNLIIIFGNHYSNYVDGSFNIKNNGIGNGPSIIYIVFAIILVAVVALVTYRLRKK